MKIRQLGWVFSAAFLAVLVGGGFQNPTDKIGIVDIVRLRNDSDFAKKRQADLQDLQTTYQGVLDFVKGYPVFTADQAKKFKELATKPKRTPAEDADLQKIRTDVMAASKNYQELQVKPTPTPAEAALLRDFAGREGLMRETVEVWGKEFEAEMAKVARRVDEEYFKAVDASVKEIGSKQGYSVIFSRETAPYAANDVTDEMIKLLNKK